MHILVTNDDGIQAPGIQHLVSSLLPFARLTVVAPAVEQSGAGLGITIYRPLTPQPYEWAGVDAYAVKGTPADCVKMALSLLLKSPPDLIVSGINRGSNHGRCLLYSGTVGGVIEGVFRGIPGIAFSLFDYDNPSYTAFLPYVASITQYVHRHPLPSGTLLNVNFPVINEENRYELKLTRQGRQYWIEDPSHDQESLFMKNAKLSQGEDHLESDSYWLNKGYITASPVHVDELTDWRYLKAKKEEFEAISIS